MSNAPVSLRPVDSRLPISGLPELRPYQSEPAMAIARSWEQGLGLTFTVMMARQAGKNEMSAAIELLLLQKNFRRSVDGIKCAPTMEPQGLISFSRLWRRIVRAGVSEMAAAIRALPWTVLFPPSLLFSGRVTAADRAAL